MVEQVKPHRQCNTVQKIRNLHAARLGKEHKHTFTIFYDWAFPRRKWLRESDSILRYMTLHILLLIIFIIIFIYFSCGAAAQRGS